MRFLINGQIRIKMNAISFNRLHWQIIVKLTLGKWKNKIKDAV